MDSLMDTIRNTLETEEDVLFAYLFGSQAGGLTHQKSDIDVAVFLKKEPDVDRKLALLSKLKRPLSGSSVDLVILNKAGLTLSFEVLRNSKLLLCRDEDALNQFETRTLALYRDMAPLRRRHRRLLENKYGVSH